MIFSAVFNVYCTQASTEDGKLQLGNVLFPRAAQNTMENKELQFLL